MGELKFEKLFTRVQNGNDVRGAAIAILSDLGAQLCRDAGETALAGRVTLIARVSILALCAPLLSALLKLLGQLSV